MSLAVARKVVRTTTFVAGSGSGAAGETASAEAAVSTAADRPAASYPNTGRVRASSSQMTGLTAVVATAITASAAQTEGRAVSLDVSEPLAMVALLRLRGTGERTLVGLVSWDG